jgi:hypothetical protein
LVSVVLSERSLSTWEARGSSRHVARFLILLRAVSGGWRSSCQKYSFLPVVIIISLTNPLSLANSAATSRFSARI